jgi:hypothetical protein
MDSYDKKGRNGFGLAGMLNPRHPQAVGEVGMDGPGKTIVPVSSSENRSIS